MVLIEDWDPAAAPPCDSAIKGWHERGVIVLRIQQRAGGQGGGGSYCKSISAWDRA